MDTPNFITERVTIDKMIIDKVTYERRYTVFYNESKYNLIWYIFNKGRKAVPFGSVLWNNLEATYQKYKDRPIY